MKLHTFIVGLVWASSVFGNTPWVNLGKTSVESVIGPLPTGAMTGDTFHWTPDGFAPTAISRWTRDAGWVHTELPPFRGEMLLCYSQSDGFYWSLAREQGRIESLSKVQGWRFGLTGDLASTWFLLTDAESGVWIPTRSAPPACLARRGWPTDCQQPRPPETVSEPPPHAIVRPRCRLTASRGQVRTDESLVLTLEYEGIVTAAEIDGKPIDPKAPKLIFSPRIPGFQQSLGSVTGPGGMGTCWAQYHVLD